MSRPDDATIDRLIAAARAAREDAYAPYSEFSVGAAVWANGEIFAAPNIEIASYPLSVCAERNAVALAVTARRRAIDAVAVVGSSPAGITPPCGACRQVLYEFGGTELLVIGESLAGDERGTWRLDELLPAAFGPRDLGR